MTSELTTIICAILTFLGVTVGAIFGYLGRSRKKAAEDAAREQRQADMFERIFSELDKVNKKLDIHNHYAEKFADINKSLAVISKEIEIIKKGIK